MLHDRFITLRGLFTALALLALAGCTQSKVKLGEDDGGVDGSVVDDGGGGEVCGDNVCRAGEYCCNASCGFCAPEGEGCITIACPPEPVVCNGVVCDEGVLECCPGCELGESSCGAPGGGCPPQRCEEICEDGTVCGPDEDCCPGCYGESFCVERGSGCPEIACPPPMECPDGTLCEPGGQCCEGCFGSFSCAPADEMCPVVDCPTECRSGEDCPSGNCCADCETGARYCSSGPCPGCPPPPGPCEPMEARGVGECLLALGVAWNGDACVGLGGCTCEGPDCGRLYGSIEECERATWGCTDRSCDFDANCDPTEYCDPCGTSSCPECDDCVRACRPSPCATMEELTCRLVRPECGTDGVAIVVDGCWQCVDMRSCEPIEDCRTTGCEPGSSCELCFTDYTCIPEGAVC